MQHDTKQVCRFPFSHPSLHASICLSAPSSVCPFLYSSIRPSIHHPSMFVPPSIGPSIHPFLHLFIRLCLPIHPSMNLSICLFVHLSIYSSIHQPIIYTTSPTRVTGMLKPILADFGREMGYTLGRLPMYHWANTETNKH